eukprot:gene32723-40386_t
MRSVRGAPKSTNAPAFSPTVGSVTVSPNLGSNIPGQPSIIVNVPSETPYEVPYVLSNIYLNSLSSGQGFATYGDITQGGFGASVDCIGKDVIVGASRTDDGYSGLVYVIRNISKTSDVSKFDNSPTTFPTPLSHSTDPTRWPSAHPSAAPSAAPSRPTESPTPAPSGPSPRPSSKPSQPSSQPSTEPSVATWAPSVAESREPSVATSTTDTVPSSSPHKLTQCPSTAPPSTFAPSTPERIPESRPSLHPTPAHLTVIKKVLRGGIVWRDNTTAYTEYIINATSSTVQILGHGGGAAVFILVPSSYSTLKIGSFNGSRDRLDLQAFLDFRSRDDLRWSYLHDTVYIGVGDHQWIEFANTTLDEVRLAMIKSTNTTYVIFDPRDMVSRSSGSSKSSGSSSSSSSSS